MSREIKWVDVNTERPPETGYYMVACEGGNVDKTFYCDYIPYFEGGRCSSHPPTRKACGKYGKYFALAWESGYRITHWLPVPQHPELLEASNERSK